MGNFKIGIKIMLGYLMLVVILLGMSAVLTGLLLSIRSNATVLVKGFGGMVEDDIVFKGALERVAQDLGGYVLIEKEKYQAAMKDVPPAAEGARIAGDIGRIIEGLSKSIANDGLLVSARIKDAVAHTMWVFLIGVALAALAALIGGGLVVRSVTRQIKDSIDHIQHGANTLDTSVDALAEMTMNLATEASKSVSSLNTTDDSVTELKDLTRINSEAAAEAARYMREARQSFMEAQNAVDGLSQAMNEISDSGQQIGKIIKSIDEIAFQTNLLALNAAVESARAGEAGAGFAVVADEVRNLAIRSAEAAKSTNDLISKTIDGITAGDEFLKKVEGGFKAVGEELRQIGRKVTSVADASKKQAVDIERIKEAMTQIGKFTSDNSAASEYSASAASALHDQTKELKGGLGILSGLVGRTGEGSYSGRAKVRQIAR